MLDSITRGTIDLSRIAIDMRDCAGPILKNERLTERLQEAVGNAGLPPKRFVRFIQFDEDKTVLATAAVGNLHFCIRTLAPERQVVGEIVVYRDDQVAFDLVSALWDNLRALFAPRDDRTIRGPRSIYY